MKPRLALVAGLSSLLAATSSALADPPAPVLTRTSPVEFRIEPTDEPFRWRWSLTNVSSAPVEVVTDHRLVWFEVAPFTTPTAPGRRPARARRPPRCVHDARPANNDVAPRAALAPGQRYAALVDVRDTCALRVPAALAPGAVATVHYGYPTGRPSRRPRPTPASRSVVLDEVPVGVNDLSVALTVAAPPAVEAPLTDAPATGPRPPVLTARGSGARAGDALRATVRLRNPSVRPLRTFWHSGLFAFELTTPEGRVVRCDRLTRQPAPYRDLFTRIAPGGSRAMTVLLGAYCPRPALAAPGIYQARAVFESAVRGDAVGLAQSFMGRVTSDAFVLRVSRGDGRYRPLAPSITGGDAPPGGS